LSTTPHQSSVHQHQGSHANPEQSRYGKKRRSKKKKKAQQGCASPTTTFEYNQTRIPSAAQQLQLQITPHRRHIHAHAEASSSVHKINKPPLDSGGWIATARAETNTNHRARRAEQPLCSLVALAAGQSSHLTAHYLTATSGAKQGRLVHLRPCE